MLTGHFVGTILVHFSQAAANNVANSCFVRSRPPMISIRISSNFPHRERRSVTQSCVMLEPDETPYSPQMISSPRDILAGPANTDATFWLFDLAMSLRIMMQEERSVKAEGCADTGDPVGPQSFIPESATRTEQMEPFNHRLNAIRTES